MSEDEIKNEQTGPNAPPGWYPDPSGTQRYWDGSEWLNIPPPEPSTEASTSEAGTSKQKNWWLLVAAIVVGVVLVAGGLVAWKVVTDSQEAKEAELERIEEERQADEQRKKEQELEDALAEQERADRNVAVEEIEASVKEMAEKDAAQGIIDGPILDVICTPVGGGSTDNLDERSTVLDCFAAYEELEDGKALGYHYHATMNWDTGQYTYGLGQP